MICCLLFLFQRHQLTRMMNDNVSTLSDVPPRVRSRGGSKSLIIPPSAPHRWPGKTPPELLYIEQHQKKHHMSDQEKQCRFKGQKETPGMGPRKTLRKTLGMANKLQARRFHITDVIYLSIMTILARIIRVIMTTIITRSRLWPDKDGPSVTRKGPRPAKSSGRLSSPLGKPLATKSGRGEADVV